MDKNEDYSDNRYQNPGSSHNKRNSTGENEDGVSKLFQRESAADLDDHFGLKPTNFRDG